MICGSCQKEIPEAAERCPHCEAPAEPEPTAEEAAAMMKLLAEQSPEVIAGLRAAFEESSDDEDFVNRVMIGDCPKCGSSKVGDCEQDPDIDNICIARCSACGQIWCPDCGESFAADRPIEHDCPAWEDMDFDDEGLEDLE